MVQSSAPTSSGLSEGVEQSPWRFVVMEVGSEVIREQRWNGLSFQGGTFGARQKQFHRLVLLPTHHGLLGMFRNLRPCLLHSEREIQMGVVRRTCQNTQNAWPLVGLPLLLLVSAPGP